MEYLELKATYDELLERLDQYYDWKLVKEPRARPNLENYKDELLQDLQVELWLNHNKPTYNNYHVDKFIWLKAEKVWIRFIRKLNQSDKILSYELLNLPEEIDKDDFLKKFESVNILFSMERLLSQKDIQLLKYRMKGHSYKEIMGLINYPSEAAAKTRFSRIKNLLRLKFGTF